MEDIIKECEEVLGIEFEPAKRKKLISYCSYISDYNKKVNLISRKSERMVLKNGIIESYSMYELLEALGGEKFLDIGSGGGIPGLISAILLDDCSFTLVDSIRKKAVFLQSAVEHLKLPNVTVINDRLENVSKKYRKSFDCVFSRGVGSFEKLMPYYLRSIRQFGNVVFLTGIDNAESELFEDAEVIQSPYFENRVIIHMEKE